MYVNCDNARYECAAPPSLAFRPTMMFATRSHALRLVNVGQARLDFAWRVLDAEGREDTTGARGALSCLSSCAAVPCAHCEQAASEHVAAEQPAQPTPCPPLPSGLYALEPAEGSIPPSGAADVTLRFSPAEVEDCARLLACDMPDLDPSCRPLTRAVTGKVRRAPPPAGRCMHTTPGAKVSITHPAAKHAASSPHPLTTAHRQVLRPWCHFELPESDYLSGGRRNPEQPGPSGAIEPLDPATKARPARAAPLVHSGALLAARAPRQPRC